MIIRTNINPDDKGIITFRIWENVVRSYTSFVYGVDGYIEHSFYLTEHRIYHKTNMGNEIIYHKGLGIDYYSVNTYIDAFLEGKRRGIFKNLNFYDIQLIEIFYDKYSFYDKYFIVFLHNISKNI